MSAWRTLASVGVGVVVIVVLSVIATLTLAGLLVATVVGAWLPTWTLVVPVLLCAAVGGAVAGVLSRADGVWALVLGSVAGGLGLTAISVMVGLVGLVVLLGMTPADGSETNVVAAAQRVVSLSVGTGVVAGTIFGGIGGVGGYVARHRVGGK